MNHINLLEVLFLRYFTLLLLMITLGAALVAMRVNRLFLFLVIILLFMIYGTLKKILKANELDEMLRGGRYGEIGPVDEIYIPTLEEAINIKIDLERENADSILRKKLWPSVTRLLEKMFIIASRATKLRAVIARTNPDRLKAELAEYRAKAEIEKNEKAGQGIITRLRELAADAGLKVGEEDRVVSTYMGTIAAIEKAIEEHEKLESIWKRLIAVLSRALVFLRSLKSKLEVAEISPESTQNIERSLFSEYQEIMDDIEELEKENFFQ